MSTTSEVSVGDRVAIYDLFVRYAGALDYRRWEWLDEVFTEDVNSYWPKGFRLSGRAELVALIQDRFSVIGNTHHLFGNYSVSPEGDKLVASVQMRPYHSGTGERAHLFEESLARFEGRARRTADGWRFEHFGEAVAIVLGTRAVFGLPD